LVVEKSDGLERQWNAFEFHRGAKNWEPSKWSPCTAVTIVVLTLMATLCLFYFYRIVFVSTKVDNQNPTANAAVSSQLKPLTRSLVDIDPNSPANIKVWIRPLENTLSCKKGAAWELVVLPCHSYLSITQNNLVSTYAYDKHGLHPESNTEHKDKVDRDVSSDGQLAKKLVDIYENDRKGNEWTGDKYNWSVGPTHDCVSWVNHVLRDLGINRKVEDYFESYEIW